MRRDMFNQLIFYYILNRTNGIIGIKERIEIRKLGIYFSRYGYLHLYDAEDIIEEAKYHKFLKSIQQ